MAWVQHRRRLAENRSRWPYTRNLILTLYLVTTNFVHSALAEEMTDLEGEHTKWPPVEGNTNEVILKEESKTEERRSVNEDEDLMVVQPRLAYDNLMRSDIMASASLPSISNKKSHKNKKRKTTKRDKSEQLDSTRDELDTILGAIQIARHHKLTRNDIRRLAKTALELADKKKHKEKTRKQKGQQKTKVKEEKASKVEGHRLNEDVPSILDQASLDSNHVTGFETPGADLSLPKGKKQRDDVDDLPNKDSFKRAKSIQDLLDSDNLESSSVRIQKPSDIDVDTNLSSDNRTIGNRSSSNATSTQASEKDSDVLENDQDSTSKGDANEIVDFSSDLPSRNGTSTKEPDMVLIAEHNKTSKPGNALLSDEAMRGQKEKEGIKSTDDSQVNIAKTNKGELPKTEGGSASNITVESFANVNPKQPRTPNLGQSNTSIASTPQHKHNIDFKTESAATQKSQLPGSKMIPESKMEESASRRKIFKQNPTEAISKRQRKGLKTKKRKDNKKARTKHVRLYKKSNIPEVDKKEKIKTLQTLLNKASPKKIPGKFLPDFPSGLRMIAWRELLKKKTTELQTLKRESTDEEKQESNSKLESVANADEKPVEVNIEIGGDAVGDTVSPGTKEETESEKVGQKSKKKSNTEFLGNESREKEGLRLQDDSVQSEKKNDIRKGIGNFSSDTDEGSFSHVNYLKKHLDEAQSLRKLIAKALVNHCQATGKRILQAFVAMDKALSRAQAIANIIGKKFHVNPERIDNLVGEKENEVVETFLRDIFSKFS